MKLVFYAYNVKLVARAIKGKTQSVIEVQKEMPPASVIPSTQAGQLFPAVDQNASAQSEIGGKPGTLRFSSHDYNLDATEIIERFY
jgi:hypothetical protein